MLDGVDAGVGGADDVPTVRGDRHAQPMGFVDGDFNQVEGKKLIDLEDVAPEILFPLHRSAHFIRRRDDDVVARGARAEGVVPGADAADGASRHPDARSANFSQSRPLFLRERPRAVLVKFDIGAGGNAEMEIELAMKILQVAMAIDKARQNALAPNIDHLRIGRNSDFAATAHRLEFACLNNDDGIVDGRPASAVDQFSTLHDECLLCHDIFLPVRISRLLEVRVCRQFGAIYPWAQRI